MNTALCQNLNGFYSGGGDGVSGEARAIIDVLRSLLRPITNAISLSAWKTSVKNELEEVYNEAGEQGWDGYGGTAISPATHDAACKFISALPPDIPAPEITPQGDGEISFEWYRDPAHTFSVSVGHDHRLAFAGFFGSDEIFGAVTFFGQMPPRVEKLIRDVYP